MRKMTQGSIARHLIAYALPLILGNLFQLTYNAVDSIVIGKFAGENALAAVSAANPVMTIVILGVSGVSIGASVLMSRFYGAGDEDALRREVATTIVFGAIASLVVFAVGWPLSGPVLRLMNVPGEILEMATRYLQVIFVGFLFTFQYNILAAALRSVGDSRTPVVYLALASVMNAGLDVLLVWNSGVPAELETTPYEAAQNGARLYRVTGQLAQAILDGYITAAYSPDDVFSDLPEKEAAYVLVLP